MLAFLALALAAFPTPQARAPRVAQALRLTAGPDIVLVIGDDIGWDDLAAVSAAGRAPNLTALGQQGFVFSNMNSAPVCSPTRRMIYSGEFYANQSGNVCGPSTGMEMPTAATTLFEALPDSYTVGFVGKWHVGTNPSGPWASVAQTHGIDVARAFLPHFVTGCGGSGYGFWRRVDDGVDKGTVNSYQPSAMDAAFAAVWTWGASPRFVVYAAQLAHSDSSGYHRPPDTLLPGGASYPPTPTPRAMYEAMIAAFDTQVGLIAAQMDLAEDVLIFVADNGTPKDVAPDPTRAKTTTFQRGVRVPCFIIGGGTPRGSSSALASVADLYATACELGGSSAPQGVDSRSLVPLMRGQAGAVHDHIAFGIRGDPQFGHDDLAARSLRYKYRRWRTRATDGSTGPWVEEFYDLALDPWESVNLSSEPMHAARVAAHAAFLEAELP